MEGAGDLGRQAHLSAERRSHLYPPDLIWEWEVGIGIPSLQMEKPKIHDMANAAPW